MFHLEFFHFSRYIKIFEVLYVIYLLCILVTKYITTKYLKANEEKQR